ncbi:hypothetical protein FB559_2517 [Actinoallomurus bryophytorum]|uniref:Uncharacterized protein n=1 Tax=Actinoallomurus bryophytorum TaxID=1490222 RepID=A0A543CIN0_9ACTN|nr:hypothetical protein FB559_2517 [Actinoallomurus bryophytorum]
MIERLTLLSLDAKDLFKKRFDGFDAIRYQDPSSLTIIHGEALIFYHFLDLLLSFIKIKPTKLAGASSNGRSYLPTKNVVAESNGDCGEYHIKAVLTASRSSR